MNNKPTTIVDEVLAEMYYLKDEYGPVANPSIAFILLKEDLKSVEYEVHNPDGKELDKKLLREACITLAATALLTIKEICDKKGNF